MKGDLTEFREWALFHGITDAEVREILDAANSVRFRSGDVVCRQGEIGKSMFIVRSGRVRMIVQREDGRESLLNQLGNGSHFGELSMLIASPRAATATAMMDTELLELGSDEFQRLLSKIPEFAVNLSRTIGGWLRGELVGRKKRKSICVLGLVRTSPTTIPLAPQLAGALVGADKKVEMISDRYVEGPYISHQIPRLGGTIDVGQLHHDLNDAIDRADHVIIDVQAQNVSSDLLMQCEFVWWLGDQEADPEQSRLSRLEHHVADEQRLIDRLQIVWVQKQAEQLAVYRNVPEGKQPNLRIMWSDSDKGPEYRQHDLARLMHYLSGVHLGLALGGGGARGLAHIGVIKAFENEGVFFDRVAGTSAGAILAAGYSLGLNPERMLEFFSNEMKTPLLFRMLPRGTRLHLLSMFQTGSVENKFRRYMSDHMIEQMPIPLHMVSVDLISGEEVVRSSGDVVNGILESINHPMFGRAIMRDGNALVDGGVLINVPSLILRRANADFVVSVDVGSKLSRSFGGNTSETPTPRMKRAGYVNTYLRVFDVSHRWLAALHRHDSDFMIIPDTSSCPFEDFTRGQELYDIGLAAAEEAMPDLKKEVTAFLARP